MIGPGVYDPECSRVLESSQAKLVAVIVIDGNRGSGFAVKTLHPELAEKLPEVLRIMAREIEGS